MKRRNDDKKRSTLISTIVVNDTNPNGRVRGEEIAPDDTISNLTKAEYSASENKGEEHEMRCTKTRVYEHGKRKYRKTGGVLVS